MPMKKKKKGRKKAHHTNNMLALGKRADLIVSDAYRAGSIKGFYVQELLMQSEAAIRELESGLDWVQLHLLMVDKEVNPLKKISTIIARPNPASAPRRIWSAHFSGKSTLPTKV